MIELRVIAKVQDILVKIVILQNIEKPVKVCLIKLCN